MLNTVVKERASLELKGIMYRSFVGFAQMFYNKNISWQQVIKMNSKFFKLDLYILCWILGVDKYGNIEKLEKEKNLKYNFKSGKEKCYIAKCKRRRS